VVQLKKESVLKEINSIKMDQQLENIVNQTQQFSDMLREQLQEKRQGE